jgi:hypothetical protein
LFSLLRVVSHSKRVVGLIEPLQPLLGVANLFLGGEGLSATLFKSFGAIAPPLKPLEGSLHHPIEISIASILIIINLIIIL